MRPKPGGFLWLLAHDLRLGWRGFADMFPGQSTRIALLVLAATALGLHLAAWPAVLWLAPFLHSGKTAALPIAAVIGGVFTWMVAQSLLGATRTMYDRADLNLLFGSPLPADRIIAVKALVLAVGTLSSIAMIALPIADMGLMLDGASWIGVYPTLLGLALLATALGLGLSVGLFRLVGPRRTRVYSQLMGASLGGTFVLGAQIVAMLPSAMRSELATRLASAGWLPSSGQYPGMLLPVRAVEGDHTAMAVILVLGVLVFAASTKLLGERFATATIVAAGAATEDTASTDNRTKRRFAEGVARNLRTKELRLLMRDPSLFAQLGLQIIYTIPIAVVLLRSQLVPTAFALVPTIVMIAAQVAGSIAWVTVSGEDAPELIATAPVRPDAVDRAKLSAVILPIFAILALPLLGLAVVSWRLALVGALFACGASASTSLINFWHPMPGNRRGMLRRHSQSKLIGLVEHGLAMLWAFAVVLAMVESFLAVAPLTVVAAILTFAHHRHHQVGARPSTVLAAS